MTEEKTNRFLESLKSLLEKNEIPAALKFVADELLDISAEAHLHAGDNEISKAICEIILNNEWPTEEAWIKTRTYSRLAKIAFFTADYESSLRYLIEANEHSPDGRYKRYFLLNSGLINILIGQFDKAISNLGSALNLAVEENV